MKPAAQDPDLNRLGWCKALLFAVISMRLIHLAIFGFDPRGFIRRHPSLTAVDWFFVAGSGILLLWFIAFSLGIKRSLDSTSVSAQSAMRVWASLLMVSLLGLHYARDSVVVSIVVSIMEIVLGVLVIWYMAKATGEATQKDINAALGRKVSVGSESGDRVEKL